MSRYILQVFCKNNLESAGFRSNRAAAVVPPLILDSDVQIQVLHSGRKRDNIWPTLYV